MWLNIKDFKMFKTLANRFVPKYTDPYKIIHKPHLDVCILQLPTTLIAHLTFHVSILKPIHENKERKDRKQAFHPRFDFIKHKFVGEVECILFMKQTKWIGKQYLVKWKGCHLKAS